MPCARKSNGPWSGGLRLEGADELVADDPSFLLRVGDAFETVEKSLAGIDKHEIHAKCATEDVAHQISLAEAQKSVIDKDRGQAVPDRAVDEGSGYRRIDATAETEQHPTVTDRLPDLPNGAVDEVLRGPLRPAMANVDEEITQQIAAERGVDHLGVELDAIAPAVRHPGNRSVARAGNPDIAGWEARNVVAVAHPDVQRLRADPGRAGMIASPRSSPGHIRDDAAGSTPPSSALAISCMP